MPVLDLTTPLATSPATDSVQIGSSSPQVAQWACSRLCDYVTRGGGVV